MQSRNDLIDRTMAIRHLLAQKQIRVPAGGTYELLAEMMELENDLHQLHDVPVSSDLLQEWYLLILARCRVLVLNEYQIRRFIGAGGAGAVFEAVDSDNPSVRVALKLSMFPRNREELFRFQQESHVLNLLQHKNIVGLVQSASRAEHLPIHWFAMELIHPSSRLREVVANGKILDIVIAMRQVCDGLAHAHARGVIHRDIHLDNVLIKPDREVKILDFGSAKFQDRDFTFGPVGGWRTAAPEKFFDASAVRGESDVFSVGCMLYFACSSKWPFPLDGSFGAFIKALERCEPVPLISGIAEIDQLVAEMLRFDPSDRPSALEVATRLNDVALKV